jgi:exopolysaccharide biosynthesis polyprenyl glycosylphosphotransferase
MEDLNLASRLSAQDAEFAHAPSIAGEGRSTTLPKLRLTISERRVMLVLVDILMINLALLATLILRSELFLTWENILNQAHYYLVLTVVWVVWALFFDCYDLPRSAKASLSAWTAGRASLLTALTYLLIPNITPHLPASRLSSFLFVGLVTVSVPVWRLFYAAVFVQPMFQQRLLIVGAGSVGAVLARTLASTPEQGNPYTGSGFRLVGFVDDDPAKAESFVEGAPVLGSSHGLPALVQQHEVDLIVIAVSHPDQIQPDLFQTLLECRERGVSLEMMTSLYERLTGKVLVEHAGSDLGVVMPVSDSPMHHLLTTGKRLIDLITGVCGLLVLAFVAPLVALGNAVWSRGPLFYKQERVGKGGKPFMLYKFRSMIPDAENGSGAVWASENDGRITPVGRILRKTRLDELPQFVNVLKGEMSLVGPRPERPEFVNQLVREVPYYQARHAVRPGITGWAQVRYRYGSSAGDALTKLQYDLFYIKRQNVYLELSIVVKTVAVMLGFKGR